MTEEMTTALALPPERRARREILQSYIQSRLLPAHIRTVDQAEVIVGIGREIGLPPIASLRTIHLINGTPTVSPAMMLALANKRSLIEDQKLEKYEDRVVFKIKRKGRESWHTEIFGAKEAAALGLLSKDNYKKQPTTMFAWRAISAAMRIMFPDVIFGLYTPEEMGAVIDVDPDNELEVRSIREDPRQVSFDEAARLQDGLKTIVARLAAHCHNDPDRMNAQLILLTEHVDKATGEIRFVDLAELANLPEKNPAWIGRILKKMDTEGIGTQAPEAKPEEGDLAQPEDTQNGDAV